MDRVTDLSISEEVEGNLDVVEHMEPHVPLVPRQVLPTKHLQEGHQRVPIAKVSEQVSYLSTRLQHHKNFTIRNNKLFILPTI